MASLPLVRWPPDAFDLGDASFPIRPIDLPDLVTAGVGTSEKSEVRYLVANEG
jgi:hypothetical protein